MQGWTHHWRSSAVQLQELSMSSSRGVALVEEVIRTVEMRGDLEPVPIHKQALAGLTFPGGKPLPASLRRWLEFDASWPGWLKAPARPVFRPMRLPDLVEREIGGWGSSFENVSRKC